MGWGMDREVVRFQDAPRPPMPFPPGAHVLCSILPHRTRASLCDKQKIAEMMVGDF